MTPYWSDDHLTLYGGDCRAVLAEMPAESVHCVVTSPPYWGLRDYGTATWDGGDAECDHFAPPRGGRNPETAAKQLTSQGTLNYQETTECRKCGARRIDSQLGLEPTPEEYVANMVAVFREVRRVLRKDGTLWLNLGDSYAGGAGGRGDVGNLINGVATRTTSVGEGRIQKAMPSGLKPKDLVGIPWRVAFALQADGWYLRSDIIWAKPNPMPESATDRPTKAHEYLFLLTKGQWITRVVQRADLDRQRFHLFDHLRSHGAPVGDAARLVGILAEAIFERTEGEEHLSLPPLYSQEWQKLPDGSDSDLVRGLPVVHRPAVLAARFLMAQASAEEFLRELNRLWVALPDRDDLLKGWCSSKIALSPRVLGDGEAAVTVHDTGKVGEIRLGVAHGLTISRPVGSVYYYDADAVREGVADSQIGRVRSDVIGGKSWNERQQHSEGGRYATGGRGSSGPLSASWEPGDGTWEDGAGRASLREVPEVAGRDEPPAGQSVGRNLRSVWTIATEPYPNVKIKNDVGPDGIPGTVSPGCPVHSPLANPRTQRTAEGDARLDPDPSRSPDSGARLDPAPDPELPASSGPDSQGARPSTPGSSRPGSSVSPIRESALASRTPAPPTADDGLAATAQSTPRTSRSPGEPTSPVDAETMDGAAATGRNGHASRTTDESDVLGSSGHSTAARTSDMGVATLAPAARCSCPDYISTSHFATFPRKLVEPCVKAGTSEKGVCPECGAPWEPIIERTKGRDWNAKKRGGDRLVLRGSLQVRSDFLYGNGTGADMDMDRLANPPRKTGWRPTCRHDAEPVPAAILDPFAGSGTTLLVAQALGRRGVGIDLSPDYLKQALERNRQTPLGLVG